jgi:putative peptidoglycan lipid II flippase
MNSDGSRAAPVRDRRSASVEVRDGAVNGRALDVAETRATRWRPGAADRRVLTSFFAVGTATVVVKLAGAAKEVAVARQLGAADVLDAFLLAFALFTFLDTVLVQSAISATLPAYVELRERDSDDAARKLISLIAGRGVVALAVVSLISLVAGAPLLQLLGSGFTPAKVALTQRMFTIMVPGIVFSGVSTVAETMLHARSRFVAVALAPIGIPIITMMVVVSPAVHWPYALAVATCAGFAFESLVLLAVLGASSLLLRPQLRGTSEHLPVVLAQYFPVVMSALIFAGGPLVDQAIAATRAAGSVAELGYANRITSVALGIAALALTTAVFPHFSQIAARREWTNLWRTFRAYSVVVLVVSLPGMLLLIVGSQPLVTLLYQRGRFTAQTGLVVASVQRLLALQIPAYLVGIMGVRVLSAVRRNRALVWVAAVSFVVNWVADYLFAVVLGLPGIALSTSLVYVISSTLVVVILRRELRERQRREEAGVDKEPILA